MNTERNDRDLLETFRQAYQRIVDQARVSDPEWPPVRAGQEAPERQFPRGRMVAAMAFLITGAFGFGWLVAPSDASVEADQFQVQTGTTMTAVPEDTSGPSYSAPGDAAIAYAKAQEPDIEDPQVTRIVGIYADHNIVDLRVQVQADDFCHWYGVTGRVEQDELEWRGGPAQACNG